MPTFVGVAISTDDRHGRVHTRARADGLADVPTGRDKDVAFAFLTRASSTANAGLRGAREIADRPPSRDPPEHPAHPGGGDVDRPS